MTSGCNLDAVAVVGVEGRDRKEVFEGVTKVEVDMLLVVLLSKVDRTTEITSSKADRLTSTIASKSRSRCAGDKKISPLVVPAVVKSAEESASQPSVVSSPAICNGCLNQPSVFMPDSAEPVVDKCSILKPADAEIPDGLNVGALCCYTAVVAKEVEVMPEVKESPIVESHVPVWSLYCNNQAVVAGTFGLPWCTNKTPATPMKDFFGSKLFQCDFSCAVCYKLNKPLDYAPRLLINEMIGEFKEVPAFAAH
uniref:Uncharacterized protein n=1 Tax=Ditylenchus dipsaci TaxID=166011 RepID=A0A915E651_9BILA